MALEVFDFAAFEVPDAYGNLVDNIVIVGHEEDGAIVFLQRDVERLDGF